MAASTADRFNMPTVAIQFFLYPVAASTTIYANCNVCTDTSGYLHLAADTAGYKYVGISQGNFNNSGGSNGTISAKVQPPTEIRYLEMDAVSPTIAWVTSPAYFTDDHTVAISGTTNSIQAGVIAGITSTAVAGKVIVKLLANT